MQVYRVEDAVCLFTLHGHSAAVSALTLYNVSTNLTFGSHSIHVAATTIWHSLLGSVRLSDTRIILAATKNASFQRPSTPPALRKTPSAPIHLIHVTKGAV